MPETKMTIAVLSTSSTVFFHLRVGQAPLSQGAWPYQTEKQTLRCPRGPRATRPSSEEPEPKRLLIGKLCATWTPQALSSYPQGVTPMVMGNDRHQESRDEWPRCLMPVMLSPCRGGRRKCSLIRALLSPPCSFGGRPPAPEASFLTFLSVRLPLGRKQLLPEPAGHLSWHCHLARFPGFPGDRGRGQQAEGSSLCGHVPQRWGRPRAASEEYPWLSLFLPSERVSGKKETHKLPPNKQNLPSHRKRLKPNA